MSVKSCLLGGALLVAVLAAYHAVSSAGLVYEDAHWVEVVQPMAPAATSATSWWRTLLRPARHLTMASYQLEVRWGRSIGAIHQTNVGVHLINVGLVYSLASALACPYAWLAAGIFALHPLQTEAIAYLASRGDVLATTGVLAALLLAVRTTTWTVWRMIALVLIGLASFTAKESAVAVLPLLVWGGMTKQVPIRRGWWALALLCLVAAAGLPFVADMNRQAADVDAVQWAALQSVAFWRLMRLAVWPVGLTIDPDLQLIGHLGRLAALIAVQYALFTVGRLRHRAPLLAFGLGWPLIAVLPRFVVQTPESVLNDHQFYLSTVGVSVAVACLWHIVATRVSRERHLWPLSLLCMEDRL